MFVFYKTTRRKEFCLLGTNKIILGRVFALQPQLTGIMAPPHLDACGFSRFTYSVLNSLLFHGGGLPTCLP